MTKKQSTDVAPRRFGVILNSLTVGDVRRTCIKQEQTFMLYMRQIVTETRYTGFWTCLLQQIR